MLSPSTCTTRPSMGGNAATTSWSIRPKVAPTWSAMPACAGPASVTTKTAAKRTLHHPLTLPSRPSGARVSGRPSPLAGARDSGPPLPSRERAVVRVLENDRRLVDTEDLPQRVADLAERDLRADGVEDERHEVVPAGRGPVHGLERRRRGPGVATAPEAVQALDPRRAHGGIDPEEAAGRRLVHDELVDAHDDARLRLDVLLVAVRRLLYLALHETDGAHGPAEAVDLGDVPRGPL